MKKKDSIPHGGRGVLIVTRRGLIRFASPLARRWLREIQCARKGCLVPTALRDWLAGGAEAVFCLEAKSTRILVTLADQTRKGSRCLILQECPKPLRSLDPGELRILYWLACAKTDQDIADRTAAKLCTVKKRLQRIYIKLGVEKRTAAAYYGLMMLGVGEAEG